VPFLFTVEASLPSFHRCCILSSWGPLHTLIPTVWSGNVVGGIESSGIEGDKSLSNQSRHLLKILFLRVEGGSNR
jgi:hypothetical protein